jgi:hypothetical protein
MKKKNILIILTIIPFFIASCSDDKNSSNNQVTDVKNNVMSGSWKVLSYIDSGKDETYHYNGFVFTFQSGGTVSAVSSAMTATGTWSVSSSSSMDKFIMLFATVDPFDDLNDDWDILEHSSTVLKLRDISGGSGEVDYLTFQKL